jgi:hypothetical protein
MLERPGMFTPDEAPREKPLGIAASSLQGIWLAEDMPMHLHIFDHIVRGAIQNWWSAAIHEGSLEVALASDKGWQDRP